MRVYKFLPYRWGMRALRKRTLKITEVRSLNDPYDLLPIDLSDPRHRQAAQAARERLGEDNGLLCFSSSWRSPVLWAHYAENLKGFCLGFDLSDEGSLWQAVEYVEKPFKWTEPDFNSVNRMLFTKYAQWRYEDEIRAWPRIEKKSGDHYFREFGDDLRLREVIVGAKNPVSKRRILRALRSWANTVRILRARLAFDAFEVVEDEAAFE